MIGIYKITSPTNKIYIGQSINVENRIKTYLAKNPAYKQNGDRGERTKVPVFQQSSMSTSRKVRVSAMIGLFYIFFCFNLIINNCESEITG